MKKLLLFAACLTCTGAFAQYEEGFEDYTAGDFICVQSDLFDIWPGGTEEANGIRKSVTPSPMRASIP